MKYVWDRGIPWVWDPWVFGVLCVGLMGAGLSEMLSPGSSQENALRVSKLWENKSKKWLGKMKKCKSFLKKMKVT